MANVWYAKAPHSLLKADIDFDTATLKVMLVGTTYDAIADNTKRDSHNFRSDVTDEITGTGYSAGGVTLASVTVNRDDANNVYYIDCTDPSWASATFTAYGAVFYVSTGAAATDILLAYITFGGAQTVTGQTFTLTIPATGFFALEPKTGS